MYLYCICNSRGVLVIVCVSVSICLCICLSICLCLFVYVSVCLYVCAHEYPYLVSSLLDWLQQEDKVSAKLLQISVAPLAGSGILHIDSRHCKKSQIITQKPNPLTACEFYDTRRILWYKQRIFKLTGADTGFHSGGCEIFKGKTIQKKEMF